MQQLQNTNSEKKEGEGQSNEGFQEDIQDKFTVNPILLEPHVEDNANSEVIVDVNYLPVSHMMYLPSELGKPQELSLYNNLSYSQL